MKQFVSEKKDALRSTLTLGHQTSDTAGTSHTRLDYATA